MGHRGQTFSVAQGVILEARVKLAVLPSAAEVVAAWGLHGTWADGGSAYRVGFNATGSGLIYVEDDDDATPSGLISTGVTATAAQWKIYLIDCTVQTDIKFYIDGVGVATGTTFSNAAADPSVQPHFGMYKASGAGVGTMYVDYVKIWQNRS